jgi:hypothetical protein
MNFVRMLSAWICPSVGTGRAGPAQGRARPWNKAWRLNSAVDQHRQGYIEQLQEELRGLEIAATDAQRALIDGILAARAAPTIAETFRLEAAIVAFLPAAVLRRRAWIIRPSLRIAGDRRTALYGMSKPPDPLAATEEDLRADLSQVLSALERVSLVSEMEDHLRRVYFRRVRITALVALAIMIATTAMAATYQDPRWVPTMGIVLLAGIVGACFSAQQRAQTAMPEGDVQTRVQALTRLAESFYFAPIGGAIGALVLFCLFAGELVQGQLFPKVWTSDSPATHSFFAFLVSAGPDSGMEMAKLLAWCFIAGFSERLIPSALGQLGGRLSVRGADQKGA